MNDHPTPLNVLYRLRMILLRKNPGIVQSGVNPSTRDIANNEFIVTSVFSQVDIKSGRDSEMEDSQENETINVCSEKKAETFSQPGEKLEIVQQDIVQGGQNYVVGWVVKTS